MFRATKMKRKKRSCAMCKAYKMGWEHRYNSKEQAARLEVEKTARMLRNVRNLEES